LAFWYGWKSSWVVELLGGGLLALVALLSTWGRVPSAAIICAIVSLYYELVLDPRRTDRTHRPLADVGQRAVGSAIVLAIAVLV
jgi:hypothetical protein